MPTISKEQALKILNEDAQNIVLLIKNQKNQWCISQCKAFEEVIDTQMYGFSREVAYAVRLELLSEHEGNQLITEVERELNHLYGEVYEETQKDSGKEE